MIRGLLPLPIAKDLDVPEPTSCCRALGTAGAYCHNCDLLLGLEGLHVTAVDRGEDLNHPRFCAALIRAAARG